jgi:hypothetical protein
MVCVGYAGYEAFDVILYIGRTLTKLNYRILIVDLSGTGALFHSIYHGMDLDSAEGIVNYRDINYIRRMPSKEELKLFQNGVVLISYGRHDINPEQSELKSLTFVVNIFPHIIEQVNVCMQRIVTNNNRLLIRDMVSVDDIDSVKGMLRYPNKIEKIYPLYLENADYENAVKCQVQQIVRFKKLSSGMEKYIIDQIHDIFPQLTAAKIRRAITAAKKGM